MFGYVMANPKLLPEEEKKHFAAYYCGLCRALRLRYGSIGQMTLSYDMTFMSLVLSGLYEPEETRGKENCLPHPLKQHEWICSDVSAYCADMNILLAYNKCLDDCADEGGLKAKVGEGLLRKAYNRVCELYPRQAEIVRRYMQDIAALEKTDCNQIDLPANLTGNMLGSLYAMYREDYWQETLQRMGAALGRFVYIMDAYEDLGKDIRAGQYNPLKGMQKAADFEAFMYDALKMMMADSTAAFEELPILRNRDIIRNILYSGVWSKYAYIQQKKAKKSKGAENAGSLSGAGRISDSDGGRNQESVSCTGKEISSGCK